MNYRGTNPATNYCKRVIVTMTREELIKALERAPISEEERQFIMDIRDRMSLKELAEKYNLTVDGIAKKKQRLYKRLHEFDMCNLKH